MPDLMEFEQRLLSELEELTEENVFALLNTITSPTGDSQDVAIIQNSLRTLVIREFVVLGLEAFLPSNPERLSKDSALELLSRLQDWFQFDAHNALWTLGLGDMKKDRIPIIYLTATGKAKAQEILGQRGYQWWRQQS